MLSDCWLKMICAELNHHKCPLPCLLAFYFIQFGLFWGVFLFSPKYSFLLINQYFSQNWLFWENMNYVVEWWSESWIWLVGWSRMIFSLRLEPSITEFGFRMTDILQIEIFPFKQWKNLIKNLGKIKKLKNQNLTRSIKKFRNFSWGS